MLLPIIEEEKPKKKQKYKPKPKRAKIRKAKPIVVKTPRDPNDPIRYVPPKKKDSNARTFPPITSKEMLIKTRKETNALNKQRSKSMETRIAKILGGRRVPMSGAASAYKGDVEVTFNNNPRGYIVECKLSAQLKNALQPVIRIDFAWFPKLAEEAKNMNKVFGIFINHYKDYTDDYVWIRHGIVIKLINQYEVLFSTELDKLSKVPPIDLRYKLDGIQLRTGIEMLRTRIEQDMVTIDSCSGVNYTLPDATYLVIKISLFREIMKGL